MDQAIVTPTGEVYLGFHEQLIVVKRESDISWYTDKIGGSPNWMFGSCRAPLCTECHREMLLVTQLFCQLDAAFYRTLYILVCISIQCLGKPHSWRILRSQKKTANDQEETAQGQRLEVKNTVSANENVWCDSADDWGEDQWGADGVAMETDQKMIPADENCELEKKIISWWSDETEKSEEAGERMVVLVSDCTSQFQQMNIHDTRIGSSLDDYGKTEPIECKETLEVSEASNEISCNSSQSQSGNPSSGQMDEFACEITKTNQHNQFVSYFVSTMTESVCEQECDDRHVTKLLKEYERSEGSGYKDGYDVDSGRAAERYEKSEIKHGDKTFYKFKKCLSVCPEQCLRYQWNGEPLLISKPAGNSLSTSVPACSTCGECRVFELQLMPALSQVLKIQDSEECPLEFGTVLLFTCRRNCWEDGDVVKEEVAYLMDYPDRSLFR